MCVSDVPGTYPVSRVVLWVPEVLNLYLVVEFEFLDFFLFTNPSGINRHFIKYISDM